jgi:hypothetical protein
MRTLLRVVCACVVLAAPVVAGAQERTGPPPEIRALVEAVVGGITGTPDAWEAMAKQHFAPDLLAKTPPPARRKLYDQLHGDFGRAKRGPVIRRGPDEPLEIEMLGPAGSLGTVVVEVVEGGKAPLITAIRTMKPAPAKDE